MEGSRKMSRPDSRLGKATHGQYRIFPMNVNGTMLMSEAMPLGNDPYKRLSRQAPTSDTRRLSAGMEAAQVSCDVGRYHAEHRGSATPDPGATSDFDLEVSGINTGRPSVWTPAPDTVDEVQRKVDAVQRKIYEVETEVLPPRGIGTVDHISGGRSAFLGNPAYNNGAGSNGHPYVRTIGTPQPDPLKYVWNAKKAGTFVKGGGLEGKEFKMQITKVDQFTGESEVVEGETD